MQEELGKRLKMNINTEKKLIKEVNQSHDNERKTFETKMKEINATIFINDQVLRGAIGALELLWTDLMNYGQSNLEEADSGQKKKLNFENFILRKGIA